MVDAAPRRSFWAPVDAVLRPAGAGVAAGIAAGLVAGGGGRVAMRVAALATDGCRGLTTENGNACGVFTAGGTLGLILFVGIFTGLLGGVLYAAYAPLLRRLGRWRGLVFGVLLLGGFGFTLFQPDNPDFGRFAGPAVNIAIFGALFPVFGLVAAPLADAIERRLPHLPPRWPPRVLSVPGYAVMAVPVLFAVLAGVGTIGFGLVAAAFLVGVHRLLVLARADGTPGLAVAGAYALAAAPFVAGTVVTTFALVRIARLG